MRAILTVMFVLMAVGADAVTPAQIDAYAARSKSERPKMIEALKRQLIAVRKNDSQSPDSKRAAVKSFTDQIKTLSDQSKPYYAGPDFELADPHVGGIGKMPLVTTAVIESSSNRCWPRKWEERCPKQKRPGGVAGV